MSLQPEVDSPALVYLLGGAVVGSLLAIPTLLLLTTSGAIRFIMDHSQGPTVVACLCLALVVVVKRVRAEAGRLESERMDGPKAD